MSFPIKEVTDDSNLKFFISVNLFIAQEGSGCFAYGFSHIITDLAPEKIVALMSARLSLVKFPDDCIVGISFFLPFVEFNVSPESTGDPF